MSKNKNQQQSKKITQWIIGIAAVAGAVYGLSVFPRQVKKERPGEVFSIQGEQHIAIGAMHPAYNSNPPTSGWHYSEPADWGVYENELPDEQILHNLEHGGIWISYKGIDDAAKAELEKIAKTNSKVIIAPRSANDVSIALVSWGRLQKLEQFDETAVMNFIKANRNKSPEPFAD